MPHFLVSWDRAVVGLCPKWLETLVNEEEKEDNGLDADMSLRSIEDTPLLPLPTGLVSLEGHGIEDLTPQEIFAMESMFDTSSSSGSSEIGLQAKP